MRKFAEVMRSGHAELRDGSGGRSNAAAQRVQVFVMFYCTVAVANVASPEFGLFGPRPLKF